ncbi:NAD(P)/FAD-dependent oxidoreductase [Eubacteriaceae bacterium ES3]|nr:NAD(P)/FAD-dependent oxidoreductase [Eubacteriaceae bacterium ES3]
MTRYDVIIIGGGITGSAIARELSRFELKVALLEKGLDIGMGATKGNGGVVHQGYDPVPGSVKAKINAEGARQFPQLSRELGFEISNPGLFVLGFGAADLEVLKHKLDYGIRNGIKDIRIVDKETVKEKEPHINSNVTHGLSVPTTTVVDPFEVALAFAENAVDNGVEVFLGETVGKIEKMGEDFLIMTESSQYKTKYIVNAAGNHADDVAKLAGIEEYRMQPRHGDLLVFDRDMRIKPQTVMFPCPGPDTKGIACIPTIHGNTIVGSTATMMNDKEDVSNYKKGIEALIKGVHHILPELDERKIIRTFAGLRPVVLDHNNDFFIEISTVDQHFIHAAGIQSPGMASAPAIAERVRDLLNNAGLDLRDKKSFNPYRKAPTIFNQLPEVEQDLLIKENIAFGHMVCRCESVTEGEILAAIQSSIPATTVDGIKRRTRAGMGRCQSGFCQYKVLSILAKVHGLPVEQVLLEDEGSQLIFGKVKG